MSGQHTHTHMEQTIKTMQAEGPELTSANTIYI